MMARDPNSLPEGTNDVFDTMSDTDPIGGAGAGSAGMGASDPIIGSETDPDAMGSMSTGYGADAEFGAAMPRQSTKDKFMSEASSLKSQATDKVRGFAAQGKDKASSALGELSGAMENAASDVDERLGEQYGEYARKAASAVSGFASRLESKDVNELMHDAEDMVRKSPMVAIGIAAVAGFAIARLIKSGLGAGNDSQA